MKYVLSFFFHTINYSDRKMFIDSKKLYRNHTKRLVSQCHKYTRNTKHDMAR